MDEAASCSYSNSRGLCQPDRLSDKDKHREAVEALKNAKHQVAYWTGIMRECAEECRKLDVKLYGGKEDE